MIDDFIINGPLNKEEPTFLLESCLEAMLTSTQVFNINFNEWHEIIFEWGLRRINLNVLCTYANLDQLYISDEFIENYAERIENNIYEHHLSTEEDQIKDKKISLSSLMNCVNHVKDPSFLSLPKGLRYALYLYTEDYDLNKIFYKPEALQKKDIEFYFLSFCMATVGIHRLILLNSERFVAIQKKLIHHKVLADFDILAPEHMSLAKDYLNQEELNFLQKYLQTKKIYRTDTMLWLKYRKPTMVTSKGLLSTSYSEVGKNIHFTNKGPFFFPLVEDFSSYGNEREVLLPPNSQMLIIPNTDKTRVTLINSPIPLCLTPCLAEAFRDTYRNYLSRPYQDGDVDAACYVNGIAIVRNNHGLAHTMRTVFYLDACLEFLIQHDPREDYRLYYSTLTQEQIELIKLAKIFAVVGRDSEVSFADNPEQYCLFKKKSAQAYEKYAYHLQLKPDNIEQFKYLIENITNPHFDPLYPNDKFLHYLLSLCHDLDLPRCKSKEFFRSTIRTYMETDELAYLSGFEDLIQYAYRCIKTCGDRLYHGYHNRYGYQNYRAPFDLISANPGACEQLLMQVPSPKLYKLLPKEKKTNQRQEAFVHNKSCLFSEIKPNENVENYEEVIKNFD